nr:hypothetical protein CFP56_37047 [Quercus suber]
MVDTARLLLILLKGPARSRIGRSQSYRYPFTCLTVAKLQIYLHMPDRLLHLAEYSDLCRGVDLLPYVRVLRVLSVEGADSHTLSLSKVDLSDQSGTAKNYCLPTAGGSACHKFVDIQRRPHDDVTIAFLLAIRPISDLRYIYFGTVSRQSPVRRSRYHDDVRRTTDVSVLISGACRSQVSPFSPRNRFRVEGQGMLLLTPGANRKSQMRAGVLDLSIIAHVWHQNWSSGVSGVR